MFVSMTAANTDVIQGTLDMLILKTLSLRPLHGFGIARRVEQISGGVFKVEPWIVADSAATFGAGRVVGLGMAADWKTPVRRSSTR